MDRLQLSWTSPTETKLFPSCRRFYLFSSKQISLKGCVTLSHLMTNDSVTIRTHLGVNVIKPLPIRLCSMWCYQCALVSVNKSVSPNVRTSADLLDVLAGVQDLGGMQRSVGRNTIWYSDLCVRQCVISGSKRRTAGRNAASAYFKLRHRRLFARRPNLNDAVPATVPKMKGFDSELVGAPCFTAPPSILPILSEMLGWIGVSTPLLYEHILLPHERAAAGPARHVWTCHCPLHCVQFTLRLNGDAKVNRVEMHRWPSEMQMKSCLKWNRQLCQSTQALLYSCGVNIDAGNLYACPWRGHTWVGRADEKEKLWEKIEWSLCSIHCLFCPFWQISIKAICWISSNRTQF